MDKAAKPMAEASSSRAGYRAFMRKEALLSSQI